MSRVRLSRACDSSHELQAAGRAHVVICAVELFRVFPAAGRGVIALCAPWAALNRATVSVQYLTRPCG